MEDSLTMKLPPRLKAAIVNAAAEEDMQPADWLRTQLHCAAKSPTGIVIKLTLPPAQERSLPLFEQGQD